MRNLCLLLFLVLSTDSIAQHCTHESAASTPTILEKGFQNKPFAVKDAIGKKLGESCYPIFASTLQQTKGLHGNFNIADGVEHLPGMLSYHAYASMFWIYCTKEGNIEWKGLWNLGFECWSNFIADEIGHELINELIGSGANHFVYLEKNLIYVLEPRNVDSMIDGFSFFKAPRRNAKNAVLITKPNVPLFLAVSRKQYLNLMKKTAETSLVIQRNSLAESIKEKAGLESAINLNINYILNDIKQIDAFLSGHNSEYLNKPCITNHNLESFFGQTFADDADYFYDKTGVGKEWVVINPGYFNTKLPASTMQIFSFCWSQGEKDVEKKAAILFEQKFEFKKIGALLQ